MNIRFAQEKDIPTLLHLLNEVLNIHADIRPDLFIKNTTKYNDMELTKIIHDTSKPIFVAVNDDDHVLGYGFCMIEDNPQTNNMYAKKTLYIDDICIDEMYRGQHVASTIFKAIKSYAKENHFDNITLNVWEGNDNAKAFYDVMGFKPRKTMMEYTL